MADNQRFDPHTQGPYEMPTGAAPAGGTRAPQSAEPVDPRRGGVGSNRNVIDDAQLKRMMKDAQPTFYERYGTCLVTFVLIALNVIIFALEAITAGFTVNIPSRTLFDMGAMYAPAIQSVADAWRFITPMFLHVDLMHLLFNMAALYSVGVMLEDLLGRWNYLLLYFIAGITGNVVSFVVDATLGAHTVSAGASTSIFGLFVATALLGLLSRENRYYLMQYSKGMLGVIGVNIFYTLLVPSISVSGHLGGAIGGLIAMFMIPSSALRVPVVVRIVVAVVWVGALGWTMVSYGLVR